MKDSKGQDGSQERGQDRERGDDARRSSAAPMRDLAKKLLSTGAEAVHLTEEGLRNLVGEVNPREAVTGLFESVSKGTDTVQTILVREARRYLDAINLRDELGRVLANYTIEVNARINFVPREKASGGKKGRGKDKEARIEGEAFTFKLVPKEEAASETPPPADGPKRKG